ncbi:hypothetical protein M8818_003736 [Zalaria obscura]|uniref:Uncharacterized protein n=1 Tax=Zalaria obscura TaxID=2024903 RepID=A0ACC3SEN7_9PEZI
MTTRRSKPNTATQDGAPVPTASMKTTTTPSGAPQSPYLPTSLETALLAIYPGTLLLGSLFSVLNGATRNAPYSAVLQAHTPSHAPSYFARKSNIFNVYFVKIGWFWITGAFFLFLFSHSSLGPRFTPVLTPRRVKATLRYCAVTAVWCALTQWFFGPPIIDRGFRFTGGQCEIIYGDSAADNAKQADMSMGREVLTHAACKVAGGTWKGGHDISGHVFILILGSAMLWLEILPAVLRASGLREERRVQLADGKVASAAVETQERDGNMHVPVPEELGVGVKAALSVAGLSLWMLLMTAAYFHTWFEKFTGLIVAFAALWVVYFLPRGVPALRAVLGMPGV